MSHKLRDQPRFRNGQIFESIFEVILYPHSESYDYDYLLQHCIAFCNESSADWAYITHENDRLEDGSYKRPHTHFVCRFPNPRSLELLAFSFGLNSSYVSWKADFRLSVQYLIHLNTPQKAQYSPVDVVCSSDKVSYYLESKHDESTDAQRISEFIADNDITSISSVSRFVFEEGLYSAFRRNMTLFTALVRENAYERGVSSREFEHYRKE